MMLEVYVDGGYRPKHGIMLCAVIWYRGNVTLAAKSWVAESASGLRAGPTVAEYIAMEAALKSLLTMQIPGESATIYSDNKSVVNGLNGLPEAHGEQSLPFLRMLANAAALC